MTDQEILIKLRAAMKRSAPEKANWDAVAPEATIGSLGFDSLSILDLVYDVQQEFGVEFEAESLAGVRTVGQLIAFLKSKMGG